MSHSTLYLNDTLYHYLLATSLREPPVLQALRAETAKLINHAMQIAPEQGQFMALLVELLGARKSLEIGVYTGYSALAVALALPDDGHIVACDINKESFELGRPFWEQAGVLHKLELHVAPALEILNVLIARDEANNFDFAFIDADKQNYLNYYEKCLTLLRPGGLLLIDNVLWQGKVSDPNCQDQSSNTIRTLNQLLLSDQRVSISMLALGDGLTLARKR